jgi:hypothetical protein
MPSPTARDAKRTTRPVGHVRNDGRVRGPGDQYLPDVVKDIPLLAALRVQSGGAAASMSHPGVKGDSTAGDVLSLLPTPLRGEARPGSLNQHRTGGDTMLTGEVIGLDRAQDGPQWDWRQYGPAIRRWELVTGRTVPAPVETGAKGQPRLAAAFAEWMMGMPPGWVTGVPGLSRSAQLKIIGNGVVAAQAFMAWHALVPPVLERLREC